MTVAAAQSSSFYVVGGPVQPDRPAYVAREADRELYARLRGREYCHVLASHHTGKTSLMARVAHRLRADGYQVATLDLAEIGSRSVATDVGRWYYTLAYRIVRELRIRSDMNTWWQDRTGLTVRQRLRDFFLEVVLAGTRQPVVIFIDRIEAVASQRVAWEIFDAIRGCFDARGTEPEYQRLAFVLLGETGADRVLAQRGESPFAISAPVSLADFAPEELKHLARELSLPAEVAGPVVDRVWHWTGGHPYLSQKVFRALARHGPARVDEALVDDCVARLFLGRNASRDEAHLAYLAARVLQDSPRRTERLTLCGKVRKGVRVKVDRVQIEQRELLDLGLLVDADGELALRNRIYAGAFTAHWVNQNLPFTWKGIAVAVAAALLILAVPVFYSEYLPLPYIRALKAEGQDFGSAREAWQRLGALPGFGGDADRLFADYLSQQSRRATRLPEVQQIGRHLAGLPGGAQRAELLLAEFWDRRANTMAQRGDRDAAVLYTLQSLRQPTPSRGALLAELLGPGFSRLAATIRPEAPLVDLEADPENGLMTLLDDRHEATVWRVTGSQPRREQRLTLTAEAVRPLQRRRVLSGARFGKRLVLTVRVEHGRPADLEVILRAPSGRQAVLRVEDASPSGQGAEFRFDARRNWGLLPLLQQSAGGNWTAFFSDTRRGVAGRLLAWDLQIDGRSASAPADAGDETGDIPEPETAAALATALGPAGRRALSWPVDPAVRGDVLVWDLASGRVSARLPRPAELSSARFVLGSAAVLLASGRDLELRDADSTRVIGRLSGAAGERPQPMISDNGRFLVVDGDAGGGVSTLTLYDLNGLKPLGRIVTGTRPQAVAADPLGRFIAVGGDDPFVRVWQVRDQSLAAECQQAAPPVAIAFDPTGRWLVAQDAAARLQLWDLAAGCRPVLGRTGNGTWQTAFSPEGDTFIAGNLSRGYETFALPSGERLGVALQPGMGGAGSAPLTRAARPRVLPAMGTVLTYDGRKAVKLWVIPRRARGDVAAGFMGPLQVAVSRDGQRVALGTAGGDVRVLPLDGSGLQRLASDAGPGFIGHSSAVTAVAFDPAGALLASGSLEGTVRVWEVQSGAPRNFFASHGDGAVSDLAFLPGDNLVSATANSVIITDARTGAVRSRLAIQAENPRLALAADGLAVFIAGIRVGVMRWNWREGSIAALAYPGDRVGAIALSGDGRFLATAGANRVVRLWRLDSGSPLRRTFTAAAPVDTLGFSADGRRLLVQTGAWLHTLETDAAGLAARSSRSLPDADTQVTPITGGRGWLYLVRAGTATPAVLRLEEGRSWAQPAPALADQRAALIRSRLRLGVNDLGEVRPVEP